MARRRSPKRPKAGRAQSQREKAAQPQSPQEAKPELDLPSGSMALAAMPRWLLVVLLLVGVVLAAAAAVCADWYSTIPADRQASYVGNNQCIACHQTAHERWHGSDHDRAMAVATAETVLGDFSDITLEHYGSTSRMYRDGERFMVHTDGPDGEPADYEVKYVFGHEPLQNYMVELVPAGGAQPGEIGRVQVLRETWDARDQRWYYLMPSDVDEALDHDDPLHWTGIAQNWNLSCAECHSTNLEKRFQLVAGGNGGFLGQYHTTFTDINVSCEACHGPGSIHIELAEAKSLFWDRERGYGLTPLKDLSAAAEVDNCGICHSRRRQFDEEFLPGDRFENHFACALITEGTYYCDGQVRDEDYVYGSFVQSLMYHKGIRCSDCHDPHTAELKHAGNAVCTSCHQHPAARYDTPSHHHHAEGSSGASCVECHMPRRTYMGIDHRRDHSLRVPRPDLSVDLHTPNACAQCHLADSRAYEQRKDELPLYQDWLEAAAAGDEAAAAELARLDGWSLEAFTRWYGAQPDRGQHFAYALASGWQQELSAVGPLAAIAQDDERPGIVRASAIEALGPFLSPTTDYQQQPYKSARSAVISGLQASDPKVRAAATPALALLPREEALERGIRMLEDPILAVRIEAARLLAGTPRQLLGEQVTAYDKAVSEWEDSLAYEADRAEAHLELGEINQMRGAYLTALTEYQQALALGPQQLGPRAHIVQLLARYRVGPSSTPQEAEAIAAEIARLQQEELALYAQNVELVPENASLRYRYGLAMYLDGDEAAAEEQLQHAIELEPNWPQPRLALAELFAKQHRWEEAIALAEELIALRPADAQYAALLASYRRQAAATERSAPPTSE